MRMTWLTVCGLMLTACGNSGKTSETTVDSDVASLVLEPSDMELVVTGDASETIQFTAIATLANGMETEIDMVSWESSNLSAGEVDSSGFFTSSETNGGVTVVTASHLGIEASSTVTVIYTSFIVEKGVDDGVVDAFEAATATANDELYMAYPFDEVTVPRNLEGLTFLWAEVDGTSVHRLRMRSDITDVSVYTTDNQWVASADLWELISAANREGTVTATIQSGAWDGSTLSNVIESDTTTLTVNRLDARGSVLYWSTMDESILRIPFGSTESEVFWSAKDSQTPCTGCHTINDERGVMVVTHDGNAGRFSVIDIQDKKHVHEIVHPDDGERATFTTLSPDGNDLIANVYGSLYHRETTTGDMIQMLDTDGYDVAQPDFSPDGEWVVVSRVTGSMDSDMEFVGGEIVIYPWNDGKWGEARVVVESDPIYNFYYPAFSPDGEWIAYNQTEGSGYASVGAKLFITDLEGSVHLELEKANGDDNNQNSYARWGPLPDDDVLWLAYSSIRSYPPEGENDNNPQIWVSAIDPNKIEERIDPSSAPFWLPGQDPGSNNHLPQWWSQ